MSDSLRPHGLQPSRLLCLWDSPGKNIVAEWVIMPSSRGSSRPKDRTHSSYVSCIGRWVLYQLSSAYFYSTKKKKIARIFIRLVLNLLISLRRIYIFTILSLPTHEHGISLHLIGWSLISFITSFSIQILYMFCKVNR